MGRDNVGKARLLGNGERGGRGESEMGEVVQSVKFECVHYYV